MNTFTNTSVDSLVNGTIDTGLNYTFSSVFNSTYNKNGTEGAIVDTVVNLVKVKKPLKGSVMEIVAINN